MRADDFLHVRPDRMLVGGVWRQDWALLAEGDRIVGLDRADRITVPEGARRLEAAGAWLAPGLIDLQFNGAFGHHLSDDPEAMWACAEGLPRFGVTGFLPTLITSPATATDRALDVLAAGPPPGHRGARVLGLHFEGPFLHPDRIGAHDLRHRRDPDPAAIARWTRDAGVALVTLAPELPGAFELVERLSAADVVVAAGHTTADLETTRRAFAAGVRYVTHLFNAMPGLHHRDPGPVLAALGDPRVVVGMIPDGIHVHPDLVRLVRDVVGAGRFSAVTDAMSAMGMPPGRYPMGAFTIEVDETSARQENGTLAGSILTLDAAARNLVAFGGATPEEAILAVTEVPAALLREESGRLALGAPADLVLLDRDLHVRATVVGGEVVWEAGPGR